MLLAVGLGLVLPGSAVAFGPLSSFGDFGGGLGQLDSPAQITLGPGGDLYVADSGNDRISIFAQDGTFLKTWSGSLSEPQDVAFAPNGRAFVADKGNDRVDVLSAAGEPLNEFGEGELTDPTGIAVDGSTVYVADAGNERIAVFSTAGVPLTPIDPFPILPTDVVVGRNGNLFVTDSGNGGIDVFTAEGGFIRSFGESGPGSLSGPVALALDGSGGIEVADQVAERLVHFSEEGGFLGSFAAEPGVSGVAPACGGNVFATEQATSLARVVRFGEPGAPQPPCAEASQEEPIAAPSLKLPSNRFHFAGVRKNRANGFALLFVRVPGAGKLNLTGRGFRRLSRIARQATTVTIPIKPKVRLRHFLKQHGKGRIRVAVTYTPTGGVPRKLEKVIVLKRERR